MFTAIVRLVQAVVFVWKLRRAAPALKATRDLTRIVRAIKEFK